MVDSGLVVRPFEGVPAHCVEIRAFLGRAQDLADTTVVWHPGEFIWNAYRASSGSQFATIERGEKVLALVYFGSPGAIDVVVDQSLRDAGANQALGIEVVRRAIEWPEPDGEVTLSVGGEDTWLAAIAGELGFANSGEAEFRSSSVQLPADLDVVVPPGFRIVGMNAAVDLDERVQAHRDVWAPSKFTRADYDSLRAAEGYRGDLDVAAVAADGTIASYAIGWFDPVSRFGQLEPVGTRAASRGQGLGKAVIATVLNRLRGYGAVGCRVLSEEENVASNALYQSVGFRPTMRLEVWKRG